MPTKTLTAAQYAETTVRTTITDICEDFDRGACTKLCSWLRMMAKLHQYSFGNVVLIQSQRPDASRVAGRQTWSLHRRTIRAGASGIEIRVPILPDWAFRLPPDKKKPLRCTGFRSGKVYDITDTEGEPLPKFSVGSDNTSAYLARLKRAIAAEQITLRYVADICPALAESTGGTIEVTTGLSAQRELPALIHEFARQLLRNRKLQHPGLAQVVETEALAITYIVSESCGLNPGNADGQFAGLYNGNADTLRGSLGRVQRLARFCLGAIGAGTFGHVPK